MPSLVWSWASPFENYLFGRWTLKIFLASVHHVFESEGWFKKTCVVLTNVTKKFTYCSEVIIDLI